MFEGTKIERVRGLGPRRGRRSFSHLKYGKDDIGVLWGEGGEAEEEEEGLVGRLARRLCRGRKRGKKVEQVSVGMWPLARSWSFLKGGREGRREGAREGGRGRSWSRREEGLICRCNKR